MLACLVPGEVSFEHCKLLTEGMKAYSWMMAANIELEDEVFFHNGKRYYKGVHILWNALLLRCSHALVLFSFNYKGVHFEAGHACCLRQECQRYGPPRPSMCPSDVPRHLLLGGGGRSDQLINYCYDIATKKAKRLQKMLWPILLLPG